MGFSMKRPGLGVWSAILVSISVLILGTVLGMQNSHAQMPDYSYGIESYLKADPEVQCIHTPVLPQANQSITVTARVVNESLAPEVAESIEIVLNTSKMEPVMPSKNINGSSSLNYTIGPFTDLTAISYGCHATDNSTSSLLSTGMRTIVIGTFNESSRAIPVLYTGNRSSNLDILFIADNISFSSPTDPNFLADVERAILQYYNQSILLQNQNKTNFWVAQDMGQAKNNCESIPPADWDSEYLSFDAAVMLHRDGSIRDCTRNDREISTANMATLATGGSILLHEIGHRPFGLADEYDSGGYYESSAPWQNVYNGEQACSADALGMGKTCRKIPYEYGLNKYFTSDGKPNDLMVDNGEFNDLDNRRIEKWFENCLMPGDSVPAPPSYCGAEMR
jgi:hypothetical protein